MRRADGAEGLFQEGKQLLHPMPQLQARQLELTRHVALSLRLPRLPA